MSNSEGTDISTVRYNSDGTIAWEQTWNGVTNGDDFGTSIITNSSTVYVCGATYNLINNDFDYVVLAYDLVNGDLIWSYIYSDPAGGMDIPSDITLDAQNNIFVTGVRQGATTLADFCTISLSHSGALIWTQLYDFANNNEISAKVIINSNGECIVTGASGNSFSDADICSVMYSPSGNQLFVKRSESLNIYFDQPLDMKKDASDNIYIVGRISSSNSGEDIKLIKMDEELNILWSITHNGYGFNDLGQSLAVDDSANIYIAGYFTNSNNQKEACLIKYDCNGNYKWQQTIRSAFDGNAKAWQVKVQNNTVHVVGDIKNNLNEDVLIFACDTSGNLLYSKPFDNGSTSDDSGRNIEISDNGYFYISGNTSDLETNQYLVSKFQEYKRTFQVVQIENNPLYVKNEIILWFDPLMVNQEAVNNREKLFGTLSEFVSTQLIEELNNALSRELKDQITIKVFERWNTSIVTSEARDGSSINVPPFWSAFVLTLPDDIDAIWAVEQISATMSSSIQTADLNWLHRLNDIANDSEFSNQQSLFNNDPNSINNINIEQAWDVSYGNNDVKVGIYDTGVEWSHEDFGDGTFAGSCIIGGWDWINNQPISSLQSDINGHGTAVTGIIGAKRNNNLGIAGIAGGDWSDQNNLKPGAQLFSFKIVNDIGDAMISTDNVVDALIEGAICVPDGNGNCSFGYGLHVMNNSWGVQGFYNMTTSQINAFYHHQDLMGEAIYQVAKNGCVNVISAGNADTDFGSSPANTFCPENYAIQVGASDINGKKFFNSNWGDKIDFIAPGDPNITRTTSNIDNEYVAFSATSCAAPHVTGTAALMVSEVTGNPAAPNILHPEDVERLLEKYAHDVSFPNDPEYTIGPDSKTQNGLVDAGNTLLHTQLPYYKVRHYSASLGSGDIVSTSNSTFVYVEGNPTVQAGSYLADVYLMSKTITYDTSNETVLDVWARDAHCSPIGCSNYLPRYPDVDLISWNQNSAIVQGCIYHFTARIAGSQMIPVDIWYPHQNNTGTMAISVHTFDPTISVSEIQEPNFAVKVYPNPSNDDFTLSFNGLLSGDAKIQVYDSVGNLVYIKEFKNTQQGIANWSIPSTNWSAGLYNCRFNLNEKEYQIKLLKQ
jgi:subtilisin family serine protease